MKKLIKFYDFETKLEWGLFDDFDDAKGVGVSGVVGCGPGVNDIPDDLFDDASGAADPCDEKDFSLENFKEALDENLETYRKYFDSIL